MSEGSKGGATEGAGVSDDPPRRRRPLWVWFSLGLSVTGPPAFLYAAIRVRHWTWLGAAAVYAAPLVLVLTLSDEDGVIEPEWLDNVVLVLWVGLWFASIVHAFASGKEYNRLLDERRHLAGTASDGAWLTMRRMMFLAPLRRPGPIQWGPSEEEAAAAPPDDAPAPVTRSDDPV